LSTEVFYDRIGMNMTSSECQIKEEEIMSTVDYYGKCGSCKYCQLGTGYAFISKKAFMCSYKEYRVEADERPCSHYEPAEGRTNEIIAEYDR